MILKHHWTPLQKQSGTLSNAKEKTSINANLPHCDYLHDWPPHSRERCVHPYLNTYIPTSYAPVENRFPGRARLLTHNANTWRCAEYAFAEMSRGALCFLTRLSQTRVILAELLGVRTRAVRGVLWTSLAISLNY